MEWEPAAERAIREVPWFVRKRARAAVERRVAESRAGRVTAEDVAAVRGETMARLFGGEASAPVDQGVDLVDDSVTAPAVDDLSAGLPADALRAFVSRAGRRADAAAIFTDALEVRVCGAAAGCPMAVGDVIEARDRVVQTLEDVGVTEVVRAKARGPLLAHHRFKASLSGCPNACSQPQIVDLGLIAQELPVCDPQVCTECGACVESCHEAAIVLEPGGVLLLPERCVGCGACVRSCPTGALSAGEQGWRVLMGGRLGRHPKLATEVAAGASLERVGGLLDALVRLWDEEGSNDERVGRMLDRLSQGRADEILALLEAVQR